MFATHGGATGSPLLQGGGTKIQGSQENRPERLPCIKNVGLITYERHMPVSYTHLDVYKRHVCVCVCVCDTNLEVMFAYLYLYFITD